MVVSGFTMSYPSIWAQYSSFYSAECAVSTSTVVIPEFTNTFTEIGSEPSWTSTNVYPERTESFIIQTGKHIAMPATTDPARFFYRAEGWNYDGNSPATVWPEMLEYLAGLQTVWEQMEGQDHTGDDLAYHATPAAACFDPPEHARAAAGFDAPGCATCRATATLAGGSDGAIATITTGVAGGNPVVPDRTFIRTTTVNGQAEEQTVIAPAPIATPPPGEVTLIREVTSNEQTLTETIVSVSAAPTALASEETIVRTVTGPDGAVSTQTLVSVSAAPTALASEETIVRTITGPEGAVSTQTLVSVAPGVGPQPSEVTLVTTATLDGTPVVQTIVSISAANQGGSESGDMITSASGTPAQATVTRTIVSDGQTYVQTLISPVETGSSPGETTLVRTTTSDGTTLVQTVVSQLPSGGTGGGEGGEGSTASATSGSAGSEYSGPAVVSEGAALNHRAGKGLAVMTVVVAVGLIL
ncbi:hypothetical protein UCDDA912_g08726 [Diaporthe ampelina]|uniref:Uncharacterized protein n=1 Tax=Diaporthe ampelina TaxID=1214573 RepID=A0A0G2H7W7_9PEZI|nr:hypothetical protein UCDDA912_g08726 [Diaporthe ampelina]